jgi:YD repeat-containing protein
MSENFPKYTHDERGNELTFEDSAGRWSKHTYDARDNMLTFEDSTSQSETVI